MSSRHGTPRRLFFARSLNSLIMSRNPAIVGIDTGGTFTDLIAFVDGTVRTHKVLSTPDNPARAVLGGLQELLPDTAAEVLTYGSTVATNALLERSGARVVLVTTAGFEDVIEIGRQNRPDLYALEPQRPQPLVPARRRVGMVERMLHDGTALITPSRQALQSVVRAICRLRPDAVAVCLLHSYANPAHERLLGAALAATTDVLCSLSHELNAEYREYERTSTTVINAYVGPVMQRHLQALEQGLGRTRFRVMQSNGGAIAARLAGREAVRTALSGPAGGAIGAWRVAQALGLRRVITFDMGGTSTDVCLLDGALRFRSAWEIGGLPIKVPAIDIHTVGAGGGSIAAMDVGGALRVGPESAGADPGPACYGRGTAATVTDANVVLGRLVADAFLGGRMELQTERAMAAMRRLGQRLGLAGDAAAEGVVRVVNASMERAIRRISVERGHDPRQYALIAFGGAAGQHACELAATLGIRQVVVPRYPGLLSAWGAAAADVQRDYVRTVRLTNPAPARLRALFAPLERRARAALRADGVPTARCRVRKSVEARYAGQSHEIALPLGAGVVRRFHAAHRRLYGYADPQRAVEVVNLRVLGIGQGPRPQSDRGWVQSSQPARRVRVRWDGRWRRGTMVPRDGMRPGMTVRGPAVITEFSATTVVPPGWVAGVDPTGHLVVRHAH